MIRAISVRAGEPRHLQGLLTRPIIIQACERRALNLFDKIREYSNCGARTACNAVSSGLCSLNPRTRQRADNKKRVSDGNGYLSSEIMRYRKPIFNYRSRLKVISRSGSRDSRIQGCESARSGFSPDSERTFMVGVSRYKYYNNS